MSVSAREVALAICRGRICSSRAKHNKPCEYHLEEAEILVKYLYDFGLEVTHRPSK